MISIQRNNPFIGCNPTGISFILMKLFKNQSFRIIYSIELQLKLLLASNQSINLKVDFLTIFLDILKEASLKNKDSIEKLN